MNQPNKKIQTQPKDDNLNKSIETTKTEKREKDLENLNRNLMKKLYADLYTKNVSFYQEKNLTFENFLFHFYNDLSHCWILTTPIINYYYKEWI